MEGWSLGNSDRLQVAAVGEGALHAAPAGLLGVFLLSRGPVTLPQSSPNASLTRGTVSALGIPPHFVSTAAQGQLFLGHGQPGPPPTASSHIDLALAEVLRRL